MSPVRQAPLEAHPGYESPCGVMSSPAPAGGAYNRGYESPCGVMSRTCTRVPKPLPPLRIPMRGYEIRPQLAVYRVSPVTNPHAGL